MLDNIGRVVFVNAAVGLASPSIDNWGHLGGLVGGASVAAAVGPTLRWRYDAAGYGRLVDTTPLFAPRRRSRRGRARLAY